MSDVVKARLTPRGPSGDTGPTLEAEVAFGAAGVKLLEDLSWTVTDHTDRVEVKDEDGKLLCRIGLRHASFGGDTVEARACTLFTFPDWPVSHDSR